ncbi:MAG TPA: hypothetical protein PKE16_01555 [Hyphomicrobium sp.]|nr:hypothetical protein [Hyphomicrobium sp.]
MTSTRRIFAPVARIMAAATLSMPLAVLGGCGMSSLTSGLGGGMFGSSSENTQVASVNEAQLLDAAKSNDTTATGSTFSGDVDAGCPRLVIAPHDNYITFYEIGHVGDALAVAQRGEITKTARECQVEPGRVTVKYGFSGRLLLGPKGQPGSVTLPITVSVNDGKRTRITTDSVKLDVNVGLDKPISYFSTVRTVTFPIAEGTRPGEYQLVVGFDSKAPSSG